MTPTTHAILFSQVNEAQSPPQRVDHARAFPTSSRARFGRFFSAGVVPWRRAGSVAPQFDPTKLGEIRAKMQAFVDQQQIAGAVTVVGTAEGIVSQEAVGWQNIEQKLPMSPSTCSASRR